MARPTRNMEQWLRFDTAKGHGDPVSDPVLVGSEVLMGSSDRTGQCLMTVIGSDRAHPETRVGVFTRVLTA